MGGKSRAEPSGNAEVKAAANGDGVAAQGGTSQKRTRGPSVHSGAAGSAEGPSEDTLQRMLPLVLERLEPGGAAQCSFVCKVWRQECQARGICNRTIQLCLALAEGGDVERLKQNVMRRLDASTDDPERAMYLDASTFLQRMEFKGGELPEWLQAASQEPDASFMSRGATSTAEALGLPLVRWVGKPQGRVRELDTISGHSTHVHCVAISPDGKHLVTGSDDTLVKIWNSETGTEVRLDPESCVGPYSIGYRRVPVPGLGHRCVKYLHVCLKAARVPCPTES